MTVMSLEEFSKPTQKVMSLEEFSKPQTMSLEEFSKPVKEDKSVTDPSFMRDVALKTVKDVGGEFAKYGKGVYEAAKKPWDTAFDTAGAIGATMAGIGAFPIKGPASVVSQIPIEPKKGSSFEKIKDTAKTIEEYPLSMPAPESNAGKIQGIIETPFRWLEELTNYTSGHFKKDRHIPQLVKTIVFQNNDAVTDEEIDYFVRTPITITMLLGLLKSNVGGKIKDVKTQARLEKALEQTRKEHDSGRSLLNDTNNTLDITNVGTEGSLQKRRYGQESPEFQQKKAMDMAKQTDYAYSPENMKGFEQETAKLPVKKEIQNAIFDKTGIGEASYIPPQKAEPIGRTQYERSNLGPRDGLRSQVILGDPKIDVMRNGLQDTTQETLKNAPSVEPQIKSPPQKYSDRYISDMEKLRRDRAITEAENFRDAQYPYRIKENILRKEQPTQTEPTPNIGTKYVGKTPGYRNAPPNTPPLSELAETIREKRRIEQGKPKSTSFLQDLNDMLGNKGLALENEARTQIRTEAQRRVVETISKKMREFGGDINKVKEYLRGEGATPRQLQTALKLYRDSNKKDDTINVGTEQLKPTVDTTSLRQKANDVLGIKNKDPINNLTKKERRNRYRQTMTPEQRRMVKFTPEEQAKIKDYEAKRDLSIDNIKKRGTITEKEGLFQDAIIKPIKKQLKRYHTKSLGLEDIARKIDRPSGTEKGSTFDIVFDSPNRGLAKSYDWFYNIAEHIGSKLPKNTRMSEAFNKPITWSKTVDYTNYTLDNGKQIKLTPGERIAIKMMSENPKNRQHLFGGGLEKNGKEIKLTKKDVSKIIEDSNKSPEEVQAYNAFREQFEMQRPEIEALAKRNGDSIKFEENHFPVNVVGDAIERNYLTGNFGKSGKKFSSGVESTGIIKEKTGGLEPVHLEDAFVVSAKNLKAASEYVGMAEPMRIAKTFVNDPKVASAIKEAYGPLVLKRMREQIYNLENHEAVSSLDRAALDIARRITPAKLGANPFVIMKQPVSIWGVLTEMQPKHFFKGLFSLPETYDVMGKYNGKIKNRSKGYMNIETGQVKSANMAKSLYTDKTSLGDKLLAGVRWGDHQAVGRIWNMAKSEIQELNPTLKGEELMYRIADRTEELIRRTQPAYDYIDRSVVASESGIVPKMYTLFKTQTNKNYRMITNSIERYLDSDRGMPATKKLLSDMAINLIVMPMQIVAINELRNFVFGLGKDEPENTDQDTIPKSVKRAIGEYLKTVSGNAYLVGDVVTGVIRRAEKGTSYGLQEDNVVEGFLRLVKDTGANGIASIQDIVSQEVERGFLTNEKKYKRSVAKTIDGVATIALEYNRIPYGTFKRWAMIPYNLLTKEDKPISSGKKKQFDIGIKK